MELRLTDITLTLLICTLNHLALSVSTETLTKNNQTIFQDKKPILLIVSYDGFRNEYLKRNVTPNMLKFRKEGVYSDHMLSVFPTKTFTNHFSIATGFYPNIHGVLANSLFDSTEGRLDYSYKLFHYNESIQPIWTLNEKRGGHSGCMMWPGTNFNYSNTECTYTEAYNTSVPFTDRVDKVMKWITDPVKPANLVMLYSEQPDKLAHIVGPNSDNITAVVAKLDFLTKYIQEQLAVYKMENRTNVIHLSDHGMAEVKQSKLINLTDYLEPGTYSIYGTSPVLQIVPTKEKLDEVYDRLKAFSKSNGHFEVYKSEDLSIRWHARNKQRFGPIVAIANMDYGFQDLWRYVKSNDTNTFGVHGYDNEEEQMYPVFMAKGPAFKKDGHEVKPFETVDLFYLFTKILNIEDTTKRNGSIDRILDTLASSTPNESNNTIKIVAILVGIGVLLAVIIYVIKVQMKKRSYYRP